MQSHPWCPLTLAVKAKIDVDVDYVDCDDGDDDKNDVCTSLSVPTAKRLST